jgi:hypothetical protein
MKKGRVTGEKGRRPVCNGPFPVAARRDAVCKGPFPPVKGPARDKSRPVTGGEGPVTEKPGRFPVCKGPFHLCIGTEIEGKRRTLTGRRPFQGRRRRVLENPRPFTGRPGSVHSSSSQRRKFRLETRSSIATERITASFECPCCVTTAPNRSSAGSAVRYGTLGAKAQLSVAGTAQPPPRGRPWSCSPSELAPPSQAS